MSEKEPDKCCFCGTIWGALIQLHQGWCCADCFKKYILYLNEKDIEGFKTRGKVTPFQTVAGETMK